MELRCPLFMQFTLQTWTDTDCIYIMSQNYRHHATIPTGLLVCTLFLNKYKICLLTSHAIKLSTLFLLFLPLCICNHERHCANLQTDKSNKQQKRNTYYIYIHTCIYTCIYCFLQWYIVYPFFAACNKHFGKPNLISCSDLISCPNVSYWIFVKWTNVYVNDYP